MANAQTYNGVFVDESAAKSGTIRVKDGVVEQYKDGTWVEVEVNNPFVLHTEFDPIKADVAHNSASIAENTKTALDTVENLRKFKQDVESEHQSLQDGITKNEGSISSLEDNLKKLKELLDKIQKQADALNASNSELKIDVNYARENHATKTDISNVNDRISAVVDTINHKIDSLNIPDVTTMVMNNLERNKGYSKGDIANSVKLPSSYYLECVAAGITGDKEISGLENATLNQVFVDGTAAWVVRTKDIFDEKSGRISYNFAPLWQPVSQVKALDKKTKDFIDIPITKNENITTTHPEILKKELARALEAPISQNTNSLLNSYTINLQDQNKTEKSYNINPVQESEDTGITIKKTISNVDISFNETTTGTLTDNTNIYYSLSDPIYTGFYNSSSVRSETQTFGIALIAPGGTANGTNWVNIDGKGNLLTQEILNNSQ